jgi:hypothetical protein
MLKSIGQVRVSYRLKGPLIHLYVEIYWTGDDVMQIERVP